MLDLVNGEKGTKGQGEKGEFGLQSQPRKQYHDPRKCILHLNGVGISKEAVASASSSKHSSS